MHTLKEWDEGREGGACLLRTGHVTWTTGGGGGSGERSLLNTNLYASKASPNY